MRRLRNPEVFGLHPTDPASHLPLGRHAIGMKPSPYSSASTRAFGTPRFPGSRFWIDVDKAKAAGATFHDTGEILADLDRIAAKTRGDDATAKLEKIRRLVQADREALIRGPVPANAIKGAASMVLTRRLHGVQIVGFAVTAVDMGRATQKSIVSRSARPIVAESIRQTGVGDGLGWDETRGRRRGSTRFRDGAWGNCHRGNRRSRRRHGRILRVRLDRGSY